jgi:hypothetical protein
VMRLNGISPWEPLVEKTKVVEVRMSVPTDSGLTSAKPATYTTESDCQGVEEPEIDGGAEFCERPSGAPMVSDSRAALMADMQTFIVISSSI